MLSRDVSGCQIEREGRSARRVRQRIPDLRKKILFTLGILAIFRLGSIVPTPNVNVAQVDFCVKQATTGANQGLYSLINLFSGGALLQLAIFALEELEESVAQNRRLSDGYRHRLARLERKLAKKQNAQLLWS